MPDREFKQVINVLAKYTLKTEQSMTAYVGEVSATSSNALRVILQLMCDYYEYGLYDSRREVRESNSDGVIDWERTISNSLVLFKHGKPYYTELATKRNIDDLLDYIRLLHEWVLTDCSRQLAEAGLDIIFGFEELNLSEAELEDFGDKEYIFHELECELGVQFNTRKQMLLKTIYAYIAEAKAVVNDTYEVSFFGTTAYAMVWQDVCAEVFNSKLDVRLDRLGLNTPIAKDYNSTNKLVEIIEHPLWQGKDFCYMASKTLIPDIVTMAKSNGEDLLAILDAKYYSLQMEKGKPLEGNPGVGDVTKQFLYQLAYKEFIETHAIKNILNCFIMPTENKNIIDKGQVILTMFGCVNLQNIQIRLLPAELMYEKYLSAGHLDVRLLIKKNL